MHWYISWPLRRDVPTQMIVDKLIEHKPNRDSHCSERTKRKSRWKDKNKHQKEALRRSWQCDLDAINRNGCAIEYDQEIQEKYRRLRLAEEEEEGFLSGIAYDILAERFGKNYFIGHMMVANAVHIQNREYENDVRNRYEDHMVLRITHIIRWRDIPHKTLNQANCGRDQLDLDNNDEDAGDDSVPPSDKRRLEEEADLDRLIDKERQDYQAATPQPSPDDDVAHCGPPVVTVDGKTVTVLQRDHRVQQQFGATLRAKHRKEAPLRYWERTPERRPAKSSKHDEGDDH